MSPSSLPSLDASDTFGRRQVIPITDAVRRVRFSTSRHWAISAAAREILDEIHDGLSVPQTPRAEPIDTTESIVMEGTGFETRFVTGAHVARRKVTCAFADDAPLAIVEPTPFAVVADISLQQAAAEALNRLATQRTRARRLSLVGKHEVTPALRSPVVWFAIAIVVTSLAVAVLAALGRL
jgi:hypothetical protein